MRCFSLSFAFAIALVAGAAEVRGEDKGKSAKASPQAKPDPKVLAVAEKLKAELGRRLIGKSSHGWSCSCGKCGAGPSKVVGISMPTTYKDQLALFSLWTCKMRDDTGKEWSQGITTYISWSELFALFRRTFEAYDVPVDHPFVRYVPKDVNFKPSGKMVTVRQNVPVYIRPAGDAAKLPWSAARLRFDNNVRGKFSGDPFIACEINPLHRHYGRIGDIRRYSPEPTSTSGFSLSIPNGGKAVELPLARLVSATGTAAVFELNEGVETFTPAKVPTGLEGEVKSLRIPPPGLHAPPEYGNVETARVSAEITVKDLAVNKVVATIRTDEHGNFRIVLPPGLYELSGNADDSGSRRYHHTTSKVRVPADGFAVTTLYLSW